MQCSKKRLAVYNEMLSGAVDLTPYKNLHQTVPKMLHLHSTVLELERVIQQSKTPTMTETFGNAMFKLEETRLLE